MRAALLQMPPLLLVTALAACASPLPPRDIAASGGNGDCRYAADGRAVTIAQLRAAAPRWRGRTIRLMIEPATSYRCVGAMLFDLQRAGAGRIAFRPPLQPEEKRR